MRQQGFFRNELGFEWRSRALLENADDVERAEIIRSGHLQDLVVRSAGFEREHGKLRYIVIGNPGDQRPAIAEDYRLAVLVVEAEGRAGKAA